MANAKKGPPLVVVTARIPLDLAEWIRTWGHGGSEGWGKAMRRVAQAAREHLEGRGDLAQAYEDAQIAHIEGRARPPRR